MGPVCVQKDIRKNPEKLSFKTVRKINLKSLTDNALHQGLRSELSKRPLV